MEGSLSKWAPGMSVFSGVVVGLALFNIFATDTDCGIKCTLSTCFVTALSCVCHWREGCHPEGPGQAGEVGL